MWLCDMPWRATGILKLLTTHDKIPDENQLKAGRVYLDPEFKGHMVEKVRWQPYDLADQIVLAVKKQMNIGAQLTVSFYSV